MFCRIAMISRAVDPMACSARTSSSTVAPFCSTTFLATASLENTFTCGTTVVSPSAKGFGCETVEFRADLDTQGTMRNPQPPAKNSPLCSKYTSSRSFPFAHHGGRFRPAHDDGEAAPALLEGFPRDATFR